jgi:hypothetical protein
MQRLQCSSITWRYIILHVIDCRVELGIHEQDVMRMLDLLTPEQDVVCSGGLQIARIRGAGGPLAPKSVPLLVVHKPAFATKLAASHAPTDASVIIRELD